jgi:hypothetical protein
MDPRDGTIILDGLRLAAFVFVVACSAHAVSMRGSLVRSSTLPSAPGDGGGLEVALPDRGEARAATLPSGWPVWIVHHADDSVSAISAVTAIAKGKQRFPPDEPFFLFHAQLVRWVPDSRVFFGDVIYDERGVALGRPAPDAEFLGAAVGGHRGPPPIALGIDLDSFDVAVDEVTHRVHLGARRPGVAHPLATAPVAWHGDERNDARAAAVQAAFQPPLPPTSIAAALAGSPGSYALIDAQIVRSTEDIPRACKPAPQCGPCPPGSPRVTDIGGESANSPSITATSGIYLVRRSSTAGELTVIAMISNGECSG